MHGAHALTANNSSGSEYMCTCDDNGGRIQVACGWGMGADLSEVGFPFDQVDDIEPDRWVHGYAPGMSLIRYVTTRNMIWVSDVCFV